MQKFPALLPRSRPKQFLQILKRQLTKLPYVPHPAHNPLHVLPAHPRQAPQQLLRRTVNALPRFRILLRSDGDRLGGIGLGEVLFEVEKSFGCRVRGGGPDYSEAGEGEGEEDEFGLDCWARAAFRRRVGVWAGGSGFATFLVWEGFVEGLVEGFHVGDNLTECEIPSQR
jgi:hypothetical protein